MIGGQVTPIPIELDYQPHTLSVSLEPVAYALSPSSSLRLEIIPATNVYGNQRATGSVEFTRVALSLPLGKEPGGGGGGPPPPPRRLHADVRAEVGEAPRRRPRAAAPARALRRRAACASA